ncbi:Os04g0129600, partial [Oryza sativa Japonica Group]
SPAQQSAVVGPFPSSSENDGGSPFLRRHALLSPPPPPPPPLLSATAHGGGGGGRRGRGGVGPSRGGALASGAHRRRRRQRRQRPLRLPLLLQAIEKASQNQQIVNAIGAPIVRGPWYSASIAVNHARHSVSCTFPVSAPQGNGLLKFKAVRSGDESWFSFLQPNDWEILLMDAILDVPTDDGKHQTIRVTIPDNTAPPPAIDCKACKSQPTLTPPPPPSPSPPQK